METTEISFLGTSDAIKGSLSPERKHLRVWATVHVPTEIAEDKTWILVRYLEQTFGYFVHSFKKEDFDK